MKKLNFDFNINLIDKDKIDYKKLDNKKINLIDVDFKFQKTFDKITDRSNKYIKKSFNIALKLLKTNKFIGLINGPISKKNFLKEKFFGITEYLAHQTKTKNFAMLIYNKSLSVCPITTHLPLKEVHKNISKKMIINKTILINSFYEKQMANMLGPRTHAVNDQLVFENDGLETKKSTFFVYKNEPNNEYECQESVTKNDKFKNCGPPAYYSEFKP